jgi:hypothetical protein
MNRPRPQSEVRGPAPLPIPPSPPPSGGTIPMQPIPLVAFVSRIDVGEVTVSAIGRYFAPEDVPRCRLCPACSATAQGCLVQVREYVADEDAPLYAMPGSGARPTVTPSAAAHGGTGRGRGRSRGA